MEKTTEIEAILENESAEKDEPNLADATKNSPETETVSWNKKISVNLFLPT